MSHSTVESAGYRLGEPIPLEDFLALVSDGVRYARDDQGRLALMAPDHQGYHRLPLAWVCGSFNRQLDPAEWTVVPEPGVALPVVRHQRGHLVGPSRLGPKQLEPDLAVFSGRPRLQGGAPHGYPVCLPDGLRLVVELLSPSTFRDDLGHGQADRVDRWRSYWESEIPEYWLINPGFEGLPLPPRSGLFLTRGEAGWEPLPQASDVGVQLAATPVRGVQPVIDGVITSAAVEGLRLDLRPLWEQARES